MRFGENQLMLYNLLMIFTAQETQVNICGDILTYMLIARNDNVIVIFTLKSNEGLAYGTTDVNNDFSPFKMSC